MNNTFLDGPVGLENISYYYFGIKPLKPHLVVKTAGERQMKEDVQRRQRSAVLRGACMALVLVLAGCTALKGPARIDGVTGDASATGFPGLLPKIDGQTNYIFQIHGIDTTNPTYGEDLLGRITKFGYSRYTVPGAVAGNLTTTVKNWNEAKITPPELVTGLGLFPTKFDHFGIYEEDIFTKPSTHNKIVVFTYFWRDDLWSINEHYLDKDISSNQIGFPSTQKSSLDEWIKTGLMDNGLSDVSGYLGPMGSLEREGIESTLCAMFADAMGTNQARKDATSGAGCLGQLEADNEANPTLVQGQVEFDFLSHSLGSRMLFDVLSPYDAESKPGQASQALLARSFIADNTKVFFMAANQLPILAIGAVQIQPAPSVMTPDLLVKGAGAPQTFFDLRAEASGSKLPAAIFHPYTTAPSFPDLTIVAFQDPDDLLGFKASDAVIGGDNAVADKINIVDVLHRNSNQYLFLAANPTQAHNQEMEESNSRQMILCGADTNSDGSLTARACPPKN